MYRCKKCKCEEIQQKTWVEINSGKTCGLLGGHEYDFWCPECEEIFQVDTDMEEVDDNRK